MNGCCADKSCTPATCMGLPAGESCGSCRHVERCLAFGFTGSRDRTDCDFYPRRFALRVVDATSTERGR